MVPQNAMDSAVDFIEPIGENAEIGRLGWRVGPNLFDWSNGTNSVPGHSYNPLDSESQSGKSEVEKFREAAKEGEPVDAVIGLTLIDTGLRVGTLSHLTESWLDKSGKTLKIDVPRYQKCRVGNVSGQGGDTTQSDQPCYYCENRPHKDFLPPEQRLPDNGDCWHPKTEDGFKGRSIPVKEGDTAQKLCWYFEAFDTVMSVSSVNTRVKRIAQWAGIFEPGDEGERDWPTSHDLRCTFGTRLAKKDFTRDQIRAAMGHATIEVADEYVALSGRETESAFDEHWNQDE